MTLSDHFELAEFTRSRTASRLFLENTPNAAAIANLRALCRELEKVRTLIACPLAILSGYRSPKLNAAVGGQPNSYHLDGLAADFDPPAGMTHDQLQHAIAAEPDIDFDLILEERASDGAHWLHFQVARPGAKPRRLVRDAQLAVQGGAILRTTVG